MPRVTTEDLRPRFSQRVVLVPLPQPREAWFVWPGAEEIDGPYPVVALAYVQRRAEWNGVVRHWHPDQGPKAGQEVATVHSDVVPFDGGDGDLSNLMVQFVVLPPEPGGWESHTVDAEQTFFSEDAARKHLEKTRASAPS